MSERLPTTLIEAVRYFSDEQVCIDFVAELRWANGPECPRCGSPAYSYLTTRMLWKCRDCKKQYSVKVGTIFEDSPIKLDKWLCAIWLIANSKNGISSHELGRAIGITQKSAWFVLHRIRLAMQTGSFEKADGIVEVDETFIGGKARKHAQGRSQAEDHRHRRQGQGSRRRRHRAQHGRPQPSPSRPHRRPHPSHLGGLRPSECGGRRSGLHRRLPSYSGLGSDYEHGTVDHAEKYVDGQIHSNGIENFWSLLKRGLHGTYISVEPFHLFRYLDERVFTFNQREANDLGRFPTVVEMVSGRRLTWAEVTGKA